MNRLLKLSLATAVLLAGFSILPACNGARDTALTMVGQNGEKGFMVKTLIRGNRTRKYGLFIPLSYNRSSTAKYPTIIFLHGVGEGGSDARANMRVGMAPYVADMASSFPFIVIFPQSDNGQWGPDTENATDVIAELDEVAKQYPVDLDRVSLTGLSTGGYGTWAIGAKYRDRFAALVPMGSSANAFGEAPNLVRMPIRSYHNNGDPFAAMWNDEVMCDKINTLGGHAEMNKTNGPGHDCWEIAYGETDLFSWLQQQRRRPQGVTSR
jgi:predicted peptidase